MLRAVLDTNVLVSGLCRYEGTAAYRVVKTMGVQWHLALTPAVFLEYQDVLTRASIRELTGLSARQVSDVLDYIADAAERYLVRYLWRPNLVDESDNMFVECAVVSRAKYIITGNTKHFRTAELGPFEFEAITPAGFARQLR